MEKLKLPGCTLPFIQVISDTPKVASWGHQKISIDVR
jgi:hypothetical protein